MDRERDGVDLLDQLPPGAVAIPLPLLDDHLALALHLLGVEEAGLHPVGLDLQRPVPPVGGELEVVGREIVAGGGVVSTAQLLGDLVDLAFLVPVRALEHHVLEEVGEAGLGRRLVHGPDPVPELGRHDRRGLPVQGEHPHPVRQLELLDRERVGQERRREERDEKKRCGRDGAKGHGWDPLGHRRGGRSATGV
ncbi:MAG: hypothetical protein HY815_24895 [Candidatus Riflebacteria bacterium]|nr:hypothetical protein [Candidatus Riflebacteria bacterium]